MAKGGGREGRRKERKRGEGWGGREGRGKKANGGRMKGRE